MKCVTPTSVIRYCPQWSDHTYRHIEYRVIVEGIARALLIMKKIDRKVLGPSSRFLWSEVRKKRYRIMNPPKVGYMLLPYMNLAPEIRSRVILEEMAEGKVVWSEIPTTVNGTAATVLACKDWGAILFPDRRMLMLPQDPLQTLTSLNFGTTEKAETS